MKLLSFFAVSSLLLGSALGADAQTPALFVFDENGVGFYQINNGSANTLSAFGSGPLTYDAQLPLTAGDVVIDDTVPGGTPALSDLLRFTFNNTIQVYSESSVAEPADSLADGGTFPSPTTYSANAVTLTEVGPEGSNGVIYTPSPGQPGYLSGGFTTTYHFTSDGPIPEASSSVSLGLLLALGLGGYAFARKRKAA